MRSFAIVTDDWAALEGQPVLFNRYFAQYLESDSAFFAPVLLAEYSCLTQFVREEIDLVVSSQAARQDAVLPYDDFIAFWGWESRLPTKVYELSGGWRKLLALTLFLNRRSPNKLITDLVTHLSDRSIARVLGKLPTLGLENIGFIEYDNALLSKHLPDATRLGVFGCQLRELA